MPVIFPTVPAQERDVKSRILAKHFEYTRVAQRGNAEAKVLQGERYETAVAVDLYQRGWLTDGRQISRWTSAPPAQNVSVGDNTEYDFALEPRGPRPRLPAALAGKPLLGEAKSYRDGLGEYIKKAIGYCLNDPTLGGVCFVTPDDDYSLYMRILYAALSLLADPGKTPGITGGPRWANSQAGRAARDYFRAKYFPEGVQPRLNETNYLQVLQNDHGSSVTGYVRTTEIPGTLRRKAAPYQRIGNRRKIVQHYNDELAAHAGFAIVTAKLANLDDNKLRDLVDKLR